MSEPLLRPRDVAKMLAVGLATVYRLADRGILPCVRVPGSHVVRFRREHLELLVKRWETNGGRRKRGREG
jgi:excisionase family DNA binding protein